MSVEHLLGLVESDHDMEIFFQLRRDCEPRSSAHASQGRRQFEASSSGTFIRRLIAHTIAQQIPKTSRGGTPAPYQYALQTRSGCECVAHGADVDRVEATTYRRVRGRSRCIRPCFDLVSRHAMLQGLGNVTDGARFLPLTRLFHSTHVWGRRVGGSPDDSSG